MSITYMIILITILTLFILTIYLFLITTKKNRKNDNSNIYYKKLFFLRKSELRFLKAINILILE